MKKRMFIVSLAIVAFAAIMFINPTGATAQTAVSEVTWQAGAIAPTDDKYLEVLKTIETKAEAYEDAVKTRKETPVEKEKEYKAANAAEAAAKKDLDDAKKYRDEVFNAARTAVRRYVGGGTTKVVYRTDNSAVVSLQAQLAATQNRLAQAETRMGNGLTSDDLAPLRAQVETLDARNQRLEAQLAQLLANIEEKNKKKSCFFGGCGDNGDGEGSSLDLFVEMTGLAANELNGGYVGAGMRIDTKYFDPFFGGGYAGEGHTGEYEASSGYYLMGGFDIGSETLALELAGRYSSVDFSGENSKAIFETKVGEAGIMFAPADFISLTGGVTIGSETTGINDYDTEVSSATIFGGFLRARLGFWQLAKFRK